MIESLYHTIIFSPIIILIGWFITIVSNASKLNNHQKDALMIAPPLIVEMLIGGAALVGDNKVYNDLLIADGFTAPFLLLMIFRYVYKRFHKSSLSCIRKHLLVAPTIFLGLFSIYSKINQDWTLYTYIYSVLVYGGEMALAIDTFCLLNKYNKKIKKYASDDDKYASKIRFQIWTVILFIASMTTISLMALYLVFHLEMHHSKLIGLPILPFGATIWMFYYSVQKDYKTIVTLEDIEELERIELESIEMEEKSISKTDSSSEEKGETKEETNNKTNIIEKIDFEKIANALEDVMTTQKLYLTSEITIQDVALAISTNKLYLSRYLNTQLNCNFSEYINHLRITRELLPRMEKDPNISINEAMAESGFNGRSTFYRAFLKVTGVSFAEYKSKLSNK